MVAPTPSRGYSAKVRLELRIGGDRFALAQIGGGRLVFKQAVILPGTNGEVLAHIDEHEQRWAVTWPASDAPREIVPARYHEVMVER